MRYQIPSQNSRAEFLVYQEVNKIFSTYDKDGDGVLSQEESFVFINDLVREQLNEDDLSDEQLRVVFKSLDLDGNGSVKKREMVDFLKSITGL